MSGNPTLQIERKVPTRREAAVFRAKTFLLQVGRLLRDASAGRVKRFAPNGSLSDRPLIARSVTPLWTETEPAERILVAGKINNLRIAARRLNGIALPPGETFSFWKQVGRASRLRGFVAGRELREGCIIPNIGGGLCQLSNALYDAAMQAGFEIVERHAHTQVVPGSLAETSRDATVFWNYVDLRFRSSAPFRIDVAIDAENLIVEFRGERVEAKTLHQINRVRTTDHGPASCASCEVGDCHRVMKPAANDRQFGRSAWLVDEHQAEFDTYLQNGHTRDDLLCIPIDGRRLRKANYAWNTAGFGEVKQSFRVTALRSYRSRKLAAQGAARQRNLLAMYEALAESYARKLTFDVLHITVQQTLLPFLWRRGQLGGRTFDVLVTALPMEELQRRLDRAAKLHSESTTLGDFRADAELVRHEAEALRNARRIVTPHREIARLFPGKAVLLDWSAPRVTPFERIANEKPVIVFPASTVGRKGCYELREAIRGLEVAVIALGPFIESADFWHGFDVVRGGDDWLQRADAVVLPAFVEHRPRRLLLAAAHGIPVIATPACGISGRDGVVDVEAGNTGSLRKAILATLPQCSKNSN